MADGPADMMRIDAGDFPLVRVIMAAFGLFAIGISVYELGRGVWPPNIFSLFFLFMIIGACAVGGPMIMGAIFGMAMNWEIRPRLITLTLTNPLQRRRVRLTPEKVLGISVIEREAMEGDNTWMVEVTTIADRFLTPDYATREKAEEVRAEIERIFRS